MLEHRLGEINEKFSYGKIFAESCERSGDEGEMKGGVEEGHTQHFFGLAEFVESFADERSTR